MDKHTFKTAIYQPGSEIRATSLAISNENAQIAQSKMRSFLELSVSAGADLTISPEYSCPWISLINALNAGIKPHSNGVWVLGLESIPATQLQSSLTQTTNVHWLYDSQIIESGDGRFLNALGYFFHCQDQTGTSILIGLLQFKTQSLGGKLAEAESNMVPGQKIYVIENQTESVKLASLNCADAMNPEASIDRLPSRLTAPYLLLHLQLTENPFESAMANYRRQLYLHGSDNKEIISINWARNASGNRGGSAIYIKTKATGSSREQLNLSDERIQENHLKGLYYTSWSEFLSNIYYLNPGEHVFIYEATKVAQLEIDAVNRKRSGPRMLEAYIWKRKWTKTSPDDGFSKCYEKISPKVLDNLLTRCADIERFLTLTMGLAQASDWEAPSINPLFKSEFDGRPNRITFAHLDSPTARTTRENYLIRLSRLEEQAKKLQSYSFQYRANDYKENYSVNFIPKEKMRGKLAATLIHLGYKQRDNARDELNKIIRAFQNSNGHRIIALYQETSGQERRIGHKRFPMITNTPSQSRYFNKKQ